MVQLSNDAVVIVVQLSNNAAVFKLFGFVHLPDP